MKPDGRKANRLQVCFVQFISISYRSLTKRMNFDVWSWRDTEHQTIQVLLFDIILNPKTVNSSHNPEQVSEAVGSGQIDIRSLHEGPLA